MKGNSLTTVKGYLFQLNEELNNMDMAILDIEKVLHGGKRQLLSASAETNEEGEVISKLDYLFLKAKFLNSRIRVIRNKIGYEKFEPRKWLKNDFMTQEEEETFKLLKREHD